MGQLMDRRIVQSRNWLDPNQAPIPPFDFDYVYPITVYEAVQRTKEDNSTNLLQELEAIYRLIAGKQDIVGPGTPGNLMTWTGQRGHIGSLNVIRTIDPVTSNQSHGNIPTERAIGKALQLYAPLTFVNAHVNNHVIHISATDRSRWNSMAPLSTLQAHIANTVVHISPEERNRWNAKANQVDFDNHVYDTNNPHNVTAHQAGTYTRQEIDELFEGLRETFFNYVNIEWNSSTNVANLVDYHPANWNPNYVLPWSANPLDDLPDVPDPALIYFALMPNTNYLVNETTQCVIYVKRPGQPWIECGFEDNMNAGMMVIQFPETYMYVWVAGRFNRIFSDSAGGETPGSGGRTVWRPSVNDEGYLSWTWVVEPVDPTPPPPTRVVGQDGKDAFDIYLEYNPGFTGTREDWINSLQGQDGEGVAPGGLAGEILVKLSEESFDTTWRSLTQILEDMVVAGEGLPQDVVWWERVKGRPEILQVLGSSTTNLMSQNAIRLVVEAIQSKLDELYALVAPPNGIEALRQDLYDHINDDDNPHRVNPAQIGAVTITAFNAHVQNFNNPHQVTRAQVGLSLVENIAPPNMPISIAVQAELDKIMDLINNMVDELGGINYVANVSWNNADQRLIFTYRDGSTLTVDIPIVDIFGSIWFDEATTELVIILPDGSEHRINIGALIQVYYGSVGTHIQVIIENDNIVRAYIIPGSITGYEIIPSVHLWQSPTTTTQPVSDRSTRIATTEFVRSQVINNLISYETDRPLSANMGRILNQRKVDIEDLIQIINDLEGIQVLPWDEARYSANESAAGSANSIRMLMLIKAPRIHTSPNGSTFGYATQLHFGHVRMAQTDPLPATGDSTAHIGGGSPEMEGRSAYANHRHPSDMTRAPIDSPHFLGTPTINDRPPLYDDTNRLMDTWWVQSQNALNLMVCQTYSDDPAKVATLLSNQGSPNDWVLRAGRMAVVHFHHVDMSDQPTLNVNNTGAFPIRVHGTELFQGMLAENMRGLFIFDGTYWQLLNIGGGGEGSPLRRPPEHSERFEPEDPFPGIDDAFTEFSGFTTQHQGGNPNPNENGEVNSVIFLIPYKNPKMQIPDVTVTGTWAMYTGNGSRSALSNANVIARTKSHAVIQFTCDRFPSNTPAILMYGSATSRINVAASGAGILPSFSLNNVETYFGSEQNTISDFVGHTTHIPHTRWGTGSTLDEHGNVNRVIFNIPFKNVKDGVQAAVSGATPSVIFDGGFSARMPDHRILPLGNPYVIVVSRTHATVMFSIQTPIDNFYPHNSPCHLVYNGNTSTITIQPTGTINNNHMIIDEEQFYIESGNNVVSEFHGIVVAYPGNPPNNNGEVTSINVVIPFKNLKSTLPNVSVSGNWRALMGDGQILQLADHVTVIAETRHHAVLRFRLAHPARYPMNSPCTLVHGGPTARIRVHV